MTYKTDVINPPPLSVEVVLRGGLIPTVWYSNKCDGIKMPDNAQILYYSGYALCQSAMLLADH